MAKKLRNTDGTRRPACAQSCKTRSVGLAATARLVTRPTTTSGRDAWYTADDRTTAGRRLMLCTPGKSITTTSPALGKVLGLRIERAGVLQRKSR